jgi:hypothetical protein
MYVMCLTLCAPHVPVEQRTSYRDHNCATLGGELTATTLRCAERSFTGPLDSRVTR